MTTIAEYFSRHRFILFYPSKICEATGLSETHVMRELRRMEREGLVGLIGELYCENGHALYGGSLREAKRRQTQKVCCTQCIADPDYSGLQIHGELTPKGQAKFGVVNKYPMETQTVVNGEMVDIKVWRYYIPCEKGEGWGVVYADSLGFLMIYGDYGSYAYRWSSFGDRFRTFLLGCDRGYLSSKLVPRTDPNRVDCAATAEKVRAYLKDNPIEDEDEHNDELALVERLLEGDEVAQVWMYQTAIDFDNASDLIVIQKNHEANAMLERFWPRLMEAIRKDLAREKAE